MSGCPHSTPTRAEDEWAEIASRLAAAKVEAGHWIELTEAKLAMFTVTQTSYEQVRVRELVALHGLLSVVTPIHVWTSLPACQLETQIGPQRGLPLGALTHWWGRVHEDLRHLGVECPCPDWQLVSEVRHAD